MKFLIILNLLLFSFQLALAETGGGMGGGPRITDSQLRFIQVDDVLLDTLILPTKSVSALTVGKTKYREIGFGNEEASLESGLGFLIDLSKVQSVDTDKGIINLDDLPFSRGSKLLINESSGINDVFTKNGDLIIFNK